MALNRGRLIVSIVVLVLAAAALAWRVGRGPQSRRLERSTIVRSDPYRCNACGHEFQLDYATAEKYLREGRVKSPPDGLRLFPCPACGEIAAQHLMDYGGMDYGAPEPETRDETP